MEQESIAKLRIEDQIEKLRCGEGTLFEDDVPLVYIYALKIGRHVLLKVGSSGTGKRKGSFFERVKWMVDGASKFSHLLTTKFVPLYVLTFDRTDGGKARAGAVEAKFQSLISNHRMYRHMHPKTEAWKFSESWDILDKALDESHGEVDFWYHCDLGDGQGRVICALKKSDKARRKKKKYKTPGNLAKVLVGMSKFMMERALHGIKGLAWDISAKLERGKIRTMEDVLKIPGIGPRRKEQIILSLVEFYRDTRAGVVRRFEDEDTEEESESEYDDVDADPDYVPC